MNKERPIEIVICKFLVEKSVKLKFESIVRLKGYKTISEAFREYMRGVVKSFEENKYE